jgi:transcription factor SFP1
LHENGDGTFSIVNPETGTPYPGTLGMEKEKEYQKQKPHKCEVCGKRYKNLNGIKYVSSSALTFFIQLLTSFQHKGHSLYCNPEIKLVMAAASETENSEAIGLMNG